VGLLVAGDGAAVSLLGPVSGGLMAMCRDAIVKALTS
jgi:NADH-quinone oxidoreductase subunit N